MANKLINVTQLDTAVDGFASAIAAMGYEQKANLKALAYKDSVEIEVLATDLKTELEGKMTKTKAQELVNEKVGKAYIPGGSKTLATLPALTKANAGFVYNMTEEFTTTSDFIDGADKKYSAGTEIGIVERLVWYDFNLTTEGQAESIIFHDYDPGFVEGDILPDPGEWGNNLRIYEVVAPGNYLVSDYGGEYSSIPPTVEYPVEYKYNVLSGYVDTSKFAAQSSFSIIKAAVDAIEVASNSDIQALIDGMSLDEETVLAPGTYDASGNLLKSWSQLAADGDVTVSEGAMSTPSDRATRFANVDKVVIDSSVTSIGERAFQECTSLTTITIPDSVTSIGRGAFAGCNNITTITIPDGVTSISDYTFSDCTGLTEITIPDGVTSIGERAFYLCRGFTEITIPDSVTSVGDLAFGECFNITTIHYSGTATGAPWGAGGATVVA